MSSRGQDSFVQMPALGAALYWRLTQTGAIQRQRSQIAADLVSFAGHGRLLDIGTGPGTLLVEVARLDPAIRLFGLDISSAMVELAEKNLAGLGADLRCGNIEHTDFADASFDVVTCTGSFYLWDRPEACLNEVFRILRPGGSALLYESRRDVDMSEVNRVLRANLAGENVLRRLLAPRLFRRQLRMTYTLREVKDIVARTAFRDTGSVEPITLAGLPVWLRIHLRREA